jgi:hypothetical protein
MVKRCQLPDEKMFKFASNKEIPAIIILLLGRSASAGLLHFCRLLNRQCRCAVSLRRRRMLTLELPQGSLPSFEFPYVVHHATLYNRAQRARTALKLHRNCTRLHRNCTKTGYKIPVFNHFSFS